MYRVTCNFSILDVVWVEGVFNLPGSGSLGGAGLGMTEVRCFTLDQFKEIGKGLTIYGSLKDQQKTEIVACYYFVRDNMLFRFSESIPNPIAEVIINPAVLKSSLDVLVEIVSFDGQSIFFNTPLGVKKTKQAD